MAVVAVQCGDQVSRRNTQGGFHLLDLLPAVDELDQRQFRPLQMSLVDDEIGGAVGLIHHEARRPRMVRVLADEAIAQLVDDDPGEQDSRRVHRGGDEGLIHMFGRATRRLPQPYAQAVVIGVAENERLLREFGRVGSHHVLVHDETAGGNHHRTGPDHTGLTEVFPPDPDHRAVLEDQIGRAGLVTDVHSQRIGAFEEQSDHHRRPLGVTGYRDLMAPRCRLGDVLERPHLLVAGVHQSFCVGLDHRLVRVVAALEVNPQILQPLEMLDAALAVGADLVMLGFAGHRDEVGVHIVGAVVVAGGLLHRGAAAEVEVPTGHHRCSACRSSTFQHQNPRPLGRGGHRGGWSHNGAGAAIKRNAHDGGRHGFRRGCTRRAYGRRGRLSLASHEWRASEESNGGKRSDCDGRRAFHESMEIESLRRMLK